MSLNDFFNKLKNGEYYFFREFGRLKYYYTTKRGERLVTEIEKYQSNLQKNKSKK